MQVPTDVFFSTPDRRERRASRSRRRCLSLRARNKARERKPASGRSPIIYRFARELKQNPVIRSRNQRQGELRRKHVRPGKSPSTMEVATRALPQLRSPGQQANSSRIPTRARVACEIPLTRRETSFRPHALSQAPPAQGHFARPCALALRRNPLLFESK